MKKRFWIDGLIIVVLVGAFIGVWYGFGLGTKIKIVEKTKIKYGIIKVPGTCEEYKECSDSKIELTAKTHDDWIDIHAADKCKYADQSYRIASYVQPKNIFMLGLGAMFGYNHAIQRIDYQYKGSLGYLRMGNLLGIGGGLDGRYSPVTKDWYAGAHITVAVGK
jgi:hypothetical protein